MAPEEHGSAEPLSAREIVTTRVFKAWTDPEHLVRGWGPKGFTSTFQDFDLRPGGVWRFVMHGPDGVEYRNKNVFVEQAGKTKVTFQMLFETAAACEKVKGVAVAANEQNFDRLEAEPARMS